MNKIYKFSLIIIFLIFLFIEASELRRIYYSQDIVYLNNLNKIVLLEKSLNPDNKKYLINELNDINKIAEVSIKLENEEPDFVIEGLKIKQKSGKNSIFVEALQSIANSRKRNSFVSFNIKDPLTGNLIRPTTVLEAHIACGNEISKLPRAIEKQDKKITFDSNFFDMFRKQYDKVFGYNLLIEENIPKDANQNRIKRAEKRLFKTYGSKAQSDLRVRLFENPCVIKASKCRYRDRSGDVIIYYDVLTDIFAVVDSKSNKLLEFSVATEIDYVDVFRYKSVFQDKTAGQLIECPSTGLNPFDPTCPMEEGPLSRDLSLTKEEESLNLNNFDKVKNRGLPDNYNLVDGWWLDRQKEILSFLNPARFAQLSIEMTKFGPVQNSITEIEALTVLQAEEQNLVGGILRPDMINDQKEQTLNFDFKISNWNEQIFIGWKPTYVDIKSPLDPEVIRARGEPYQSLEDQVDNILKTISLQRQRAINNNESVIHIITLLRIKPSDRAYFMNNFKTKALKQNLDLNGVKFMNTSSDMI